MSQLNLSTSIESIISDCGDGGYTTRVYNDESELLEDHYYYDEWREEGLSESQMLERIGNDEYQNGYLTGTDTINFSITFDETVSDEVIQSLRKAIKDIKIKPFSVHGGQ